MKYLKQLALIFLICILGQLISSFIGNRIPGNVVAMILLFLLLYFKIIKMSMIEDTTDFILTNMGIFFIPSCLGIIESYQLLLGDLFLLVFVCVITTIITSLATGLTVKYVLRIQNRRKQKQIDN